MEPNPGPVVDPEIPPPGTYPVPSAESEPKFFLASRTVLSALLGVLPMVLAYFGIEFSSADAQKLFEGLSGFLSLIGVIFFRARAERPIAFRTGASAAGLLIFVAIVLLGGCSADGKLKLPTLNARVGYMTADGQKITYDSARDEILVDGQVTTTRRTGGGGKTFVELGTR